MPELRRDPIIDRWVIISTERRKRPSEYPHIPLDEKNNVPCPFCLGHEDKTPPEILSYRDPGSKPNTPGWWVRVVPNKFPALQIEGELDRRGEGMFDRMSGIGAHEVVIETPDHTKEMPDLEDKHLEDVIWAYRDRSVDLRKDPRFKYVLIFKNKGKEAGASLAHSHSQLIATPIVPKRVTEEVDGGGAYYKMKERCIFCDIIREEMESGIRVVCENDCFITLEPFAPRFPFETWILPKAHDSDFTRIQKYAVTCMAKIMKETLKRMDKTLNNPPFNFILHTSDCQSPLLPYYHWHIEIIPRIVLHAGFEWGSGFYINPTPPEEATRYLREVEI